MIETVASTMDLGFNYPFPHVKMGGPSDPIEKKLHINALELKAASIAVRSMTKSKEKIQIHLKMDNVTAVTYVNKMGEQNYSKLPSDICTNRFAIETFRYGLIRRQMECADRKIHELETQPICYGYRCMPSD